jgi:threonine/homoserine/homoserine lactone efflux protein
MFAMLLNSPTFVTFLIASLVLAITPGPGVIYIVAHTFGQGRKAGLSSVGGIALGNLGNATVASLGLAAVLAASPTAFVIMKLAGAAYLVYLGLKTLCASHAAETAKRPAGSSSSQLFCDGCIVALLNPKTALFFAALLPQFIIPGAPPLAQSLLLGCAFVCIAMCTDSIYVLMATALGPRIRRSSARPIGKYVTAATFVGLGVYAAFASPRMPK